MPRKMSSKKTDHETSEDLPSNYQGQDRGSEQAYAHYYAGMDRSMRQKVALVTSFFPTTGTIADMGCGSGKGSYDFAALYPGLNVVGIDINENAVEHARKNYTLPNLRNL